jgi:hypothetical protein
MSVPLISLSAIKAVFTLVVMTVSSITEPAFAPALLAPDESDAPDAEPLAPLEEVEESEGVPGADPLAPVGGGAVAESVVPAAEPVVPADEPAAPVVPEEVPAAEPAPASAPGGVLGVVPAVLLGGLGGVAVVLPAVPAVLAGGVAVLEESAAPVCSAPRSQPANAKPNRAVIKATFDVLTFAIIVRPFTWNRSHPCQSCRMRRKHRILRRNRLRPNPWNLNCRMCLRRHLRQLRMYQSDAVRILPVSESIWLQQPARFLRFGIFLSLCCSFQ